MSDAAPTQPDAQPTRSGRLLALVRKLIDYGKEIATALQQPDGTTDLLPILRSFGTADIARILARIMYGLRRAQALEDRIIQCAARLDADPRSKRARGVPPASQPRAPRSASRPTHNSTDAPLRSLEQLAASHATGLDPVRRQPIGAVIADICRDLGILPSHPLWRELQAAINEFRGNYARLVIDILKRPRLFLANDQAPATHTVLPLSADATGPP